MNRSSVGRDVYRVKRNVRCDISNNTYDEMTIKSSSNTQRPAVNSKLKVAVLAGGVGSEREVSIQSGECIARGLKEAGLRVEIGDIGPDNPGALEDESIDVFFIALHGKFGEDGQLQQLLEERALPYTGSGPAASKLAFDKIASKRAFRGVDVHTPAWVDFNCDSDVQQLEKELQQSGKSYVVKPIKEGSSVGVRIIRDSQEVMAVAQKTLAEFGDCMIEEFVAGREITVGILCGEALPIIEIRPKEAFYNYRAKYVDERTEFLFDTIKDAGLAAKIKADALACFDALGCEDFGRVDFVLGDDQVAYALEVNTIPGFTSHSLLPMAAAKAGLSMSDLCVRIVEAALRAPKRKVMRLGNP